MFNKVHPAVVSTHGQDSLAFSCESEHERLRYTIEGSSDKVGVSIQQPNQYLIKHNLSLIYMVAMLITGGNNEQGGKK